MDSRFRGNDGLFVRYWYLAPIYFSYCSHYAKITGMPNPHEIIRAFLAVDMPDDIRTLAAETGERLLNREKGLKLVRPENYHITLAFIGDVELDLLESIDKSLERLAESVSVIDVQFNKIGTFPSVIYLKISEGESELAHLSKSARAILTQNEIPYDSKPFKGHLTIARSRNRRVKAKEFLKSYAFDARFDISFEIVGFSLIQSELTTTGPIYTTLNQYYLKSQEV